MSCVGDTCGVGGWGGPQPGDPSNNSVLQAKPAYGGIEVSWSLPTLNSFAIAHTKVYRSTDEKFSNAIQIATWNSDQYFDRVAPGLVYWYWIQFVSIHGTENVLIGPASSHALDSIEQILIELTGRIDAGILAQTLRAPIDRIPLIGNEIKQEIADRLASNTAIAAFLNALDSDVTQVLTLIQNEITQRTEGDATVLEAVNTMGLGQGDTVALITEERNLRIDADSALAEKVDITYAQVGQDISAAVANVTTAYSGADQALAQNVAQLYATKNGLTAAIQDVNQAITDGDYALTQRINTIESSSGVDSTARAAIQEESTARVQGDNALAQRITTLETSDGDGNLAQVEQRLDTRIDGVKNTAESLYTVKLTANGLAGGFGLYNNSNFVEAGFDVDVFWVGRTNADKIKPFIISNDIVYINKAMIGTAYIDTLMIGMNQVTIPIGVYTAADQSYLRPQEVQGGPLYLEYEVQSTWINSIGAPISIAASCILKSANLITNASIQVRRNGNVLYECSLQTYSNNFCTVLMDTPGAGTHNYQIVIRLGVIHPEYEEPGQRFSVIASNRAIQLMELKR